VKRCKDSIKSSTYALPIVILIFTPNHEKYDFECDLCGKPIGGSGIVENIVNKPIDTHLAYLTGRHGFMKENCRYDTFLSKKR
jgi:hypothetical protein